MTSISLRNIQKTFCKDTQVIKDVNLEIAAGEFCVFLGPSGCGKSTLLRMVAGIEDVTAGELQIGGVRMNEVPAAKRQVAMVFQSYALYPHMSVYENMAFGLRQARVDKAEIDLRVKEAAQILQLEPLLERMPRALSGGSAWRSAGQSSVRRTCSCSTNRCPISTPRCACICAPRFRACTRNSTTPARSTSRTIRPRRWRWPTKSYCCAPARK